MPRIRKTEKESQNTNRQTLWHVAIYIRLSKDDGNDESMSVTNQRKIMLEYLEQYFVGEYQIHDYYVDDGLTGTDDSRLEFQRMVQDIETKKVNCVICKNLSRAFRNYSDQGYFLESYFPRMNIRFIAVNENNVDSYLHPEYIDGLEVPISGLMNDRYAMRVSKDVRRTFDTKRRRGEFIGAFTPYGYLKDPDDKNQLIIDEEVAPVIRDIYKWFVYEGMSKMGIVRHLNEVGILTPTNYKHSKGINHQTPSNINHDGLWGISTVSTILKNQMYVGDMVQGKERIVSYKVHDKIAVPKDEWFIVENTHEPIISRELFEKAQNLHQKETRVPKGQRKVRVLSGFVRCADCHSYMSFKASKKDKNGNHKYAYYVCGTYAMKDKAKCTRHSIKKEVLEEAVLKAIQAQISLVNSLAKIIEEINQTPIVQNQSNRLLTLLDNHTKELDKIMYASDSLYMDWKCGDITKDEYHRLKSKYECQADNKRNIINELEKEIELSKSGVNSSDAYLTAFAQYGNITKLDRQVVVDLIDAIYVHEEGEITIRFNFTDQHKRVLEFIEANNKKITYFSKEAKQDLKVASI